MLRFLVLCDGLQSKSFCDNDETCSKREGGGPRKMNKLYGTASVNGTQETTESINTINWTIWPFMQAEYTIVGEAGVNRKQLRLITWNTSEKYIYVLIRFAQTTVNHFTLKFP